MESADGSEIEISEKKPNENITFTAFSHVQKSEFSTVRFITTDEKKMEIHMFFFILMHVSHVLWFFDTKKNGRPTYIFPLIYLVFFLIFNDPIVL